MLSYTDWFELEDSQRDIVIKIYESQHKVMWIKGFAGTGKTITLCNLLRAFIYGYKGSTGCFVSFTIALRDLAKTYFKENELNYIDVKYLYQFQQNSKHYDFIAIDEVQDINYNDMNKILNGKYRKIILAGDFDQQIYEHKISLRDIEKINPYTYNLNVIYRMTEKLKNVALKLNPYLNEQKIVNFKKNTDLRKGSDAYYYMADNENSEIEYVCKKATDSVSVGNPCVILLPTHTIIKRFIEKFFLINSIKNNLVINENGRCDYDNFNEICKNNNLLVRYFGNGYGDIEESDSLPIIYLMTYHSCKGLDFNTVIIPYIDESILKPVIEKYDSKLINLGKRLLFVASTRSRYDLIFTCHSKPYHTFMDLISEGLLKEVNKAVETEEDVEPDDNDLF